ncbi:hypothetical protein N0V82_003877 [Gnomoniopsis sp. IMI 355080]|nr:hypothetical protein N0V82_003877 [Gnomoniopsis sp. IMI 355080]
MAPSHALLRLAVRPAHLRQHIVARRSVSSLGPRMNVLGIETSADDTCVALMSFEKKPGLRDYAHHLASERVTYDNKKHKGIHPVEAVMSHTQNLSRMVTSVLAKASHVTKPDLICVTRGPGMGGCLSVGVSTAKALSEAWNVPIVGVHHNSTEITYLATKYIIPSHELPYSERMEVLKNIHMQAHALTPVMETMLNTHEPIAYPFLTLLVSGKHTMLVHTKSPVSHRILAQTSTNALGDAMDKVARELVSPSTIDKIPDNKAICYPEQMEMASNSLFPYYLPTRSRKEELKIYHSEYGWELQPPLRNTVEMKYDFNALNSTTLSILRANPEMCRKERRELGYHFMRLAFEHLMSRVIIALSTDKDLLRDPPKDFILSGGVGRNRLLRTVVEKTLEARGFSDIKLRVPQSWLCTDNALMIAHAGWKMYTDGWETDTTFCPAVQWSIEEILSGVDCWRRRPGFPPITAEDAQGPKPEKIEGAPQFSPETIIEKTVELASEDSKVFDLTSKTLEKTSVDKAFKGPGGEVDEDNLQLERILRQAESLLDKLGFGSQHTPTPKNEHSGPGAQDIRTSTAPSSAPVQTSMSPPADYRKPTTRENPLQRGEAADDHVDAKVGDRTTPSANYKEPISRENPSRLGQAADRHVDAKVSDNNTSSADHKKPVSRESPSRRGQAADGHVDAKISDKNPSGEKPRRDREQSASAKALTASRLRGLPLRLRLQARSQAAFEARVSEEWPPMPPPKKRHDLKISYLGFADEPAPPARSSAPTFLGRMAGMFGLGRKY